jgi:hypothetical protein
MMDIFRGFKYVSMAIRPEDLPKELYHSTSSDAATKILDEGIKPNMRSRWSGTWAQPRKDHVYLSGLVNDVRGTENSVLLKIDPQRLDPEKVNLDEDHAWGWAKGSQMPNEEYHPPKDLPGIDEFKKSFEKEDLQLGKSPGGHKSLGDWADSMSHILDQPDWVARGLREGPYSKSVAVRGGVPADAILGVMTLGSGKWHTPEEFRTMMLEKQQRTQKSAGEVVELDRYRKQNDCPECGGKRYRILRSFGDDSREFIQSCDECSPGMSDEEAASRAAEDMGRSGFDWDNQDSPKYRMPYLRESSRGAVGDRTDRAKRRDKFISQKVEYMTTDNEPLEEGELTKEASDSPFDGYGRPFTDDNLNMSEFYYHDNPANNVGPYSGPSSYSINTVAPYNPPHGGEENPAQNVGPYRPPGVMPATTDNDYDEDDLPANVGRDLDNDALRTAYKSWNDMQWFDGTSRSIYSRVTEAESMRRLAASRGEVAIHDELSEQIEVLNKVAAEYDDSSLHEFVDELPGGTVALEYDDLIDGGLVDITDFLHVGAHAVAKEAAQYDWNAFQVEGARQWVMQKFRDNPGVLSHEILAREAAIDFAKDKTMVLMDPVARAEIIDGFVTSAEQFRRDAARRLTEYRQDEDHRSERVASSRMQAAAEDLDYDDGFLPGEYVDLGSDYDEEGYLKIGEDDGSPLYAEASRTIKEARDRQWDEFTTNGAKDWFFTRGVESESMFKHADITALAARRYASSQTQAIPDQMLRSEIVRAFADSVEYLRQEHLAKEAAELVEDDEFDSFYDGEDEILW